jgi:hypothetical protein
MNGGTVSTPPSGQPPQAPMPDAGGASASPFNQQTEPASARFEDQDMGPGLSSFRVPLDFSSSAAVSSAEQSPSPLQPQARASASGGAAEPSPAAQLPQDSGQRASGRPSPLEAAEAQPAAATGAAYGPAAGPSQGGGGDDGTQALPYTLTAVGHSLGGAELLMYTVMRVRAVSSAQELTGRTCTPVLGLRQLYQPRLPC